MAAGELIPVPDELGLPEAAALLHDGSTAMGLLQDTGVKPGEQVLVTAAAGGMGVLLVQLARAAGGRVIGAGRGRRKLAVVRDAGADAVVDYSEPGWDGQVRELTAGHGPDVVFDGAGGPLGRSAFEIIAGGGRFSAHGISGGGFAPLDQAEARRRGVTVNGIGAYEPEVFRRRAAAALAETAAGRLSPVIGQEYPLAGAAAGAHRAGVQARRGQDAAAPLTAPAARPLPRLAPHRATDSDLSAVSGALTPETADKAASTRPSPLRPASSRRIC